MDMIKLDRLKELSMYNGNFYWNTEPVTMDDIKLAISSNTEVETEEFGHEWAELEWSNERHIQRVVYFIKNPEKIDPINLDNIVNGNYITSIAHITDGNHRFFALCYLDTQSIPCKYGGREDVLDYLSGVSDIVPEDFY